jgi:4-hydroxyphenylpyruvate dioxygenase
MARSRELGIRRLHAVHFYVNRLDRMRRFWVEQLDFSFVAESSAAQADAQGGQTEVYRAGDATYLMTEPRGARGPAAAWTRRHPDGVGEIIFEVDDVDATFRVLDERGAAIVGEVETFASGGGSWRSFSITTAFGDTVFTFAQIQDFAAASPWVTPFAEAKGGSNRFGFGHIDHVTSNFLTLKPLVLWCKDVLGLEEYWGIEFHTKDHATVDTGSGSGLRSTVLWDPHSGVKFANNEPLRPYFTKSQIYTFVDDNFGPGVQHTALTIADIVGTVDSMRKSGIEFMPTPGTYYDALPERLGEADIEIEEPIETLRAHQILVDGEGPGKYMLQIFAKDFAGLFGDRNGGPFFLEIIQRKGDRGFGGGNFRALFESIERDQVANGRI